MAHRTAHELQEGLGETGRFGEIFIGLGLVIGLAGAIIWWLGEYGHFGADGTFDGSIAGALFFIEGVGFTLFGIVAMLAGWGRHHQDFEW